MRVKHLGKVWLFLCTCLLSGYLYAQEEQEKEKNTSATIKTAGVPPGFQFLLEKQTTAIDVFYGDVYITTTLATYTPTTVEFQNPEQVVSGLKNLITPEQVARDLTGEIDSHPGEVCYRSTETDCGSISPDTVGVIFDEGRFRADIFINPNLLSVQQIEFNRYLPASSSGVSSINNVSLVYSGEDTGGTTAVLGGLSLLSYKEQRVVSGWAYSDTDGSSGFNVDTLYWQMDEADLQYQAGWFTSDTRFISFMPSLDILGFRYSTSFKARTDLNFSSGTPLELYLPSRSRVNIFKDGRFLSTGFYSPGNQILDTSILPDGAYDIELRIVDSTGREERVTRYYVKTQQLPPTDQDLYFFEAGDIQTRAVGSFPQSRGIPLIQGGYSHRLTNDLGLNLGGASTDDQVMSEIGFYYLKNTFTFEPKILLTSDGSYGWNIGGYFRYDDWGAFLQARRVWSNYEIPVIPTNDFELIIPSLRQYSLGVNHVLWEGNLQFHYSVSERIGAESTDVTSLSYAKGFFYRSNQLTFSTDLSKTNGEEIVMFSLYWGFSTGNNTSHTLTGSLLNSGDTKTSMSNTGRLGYTGAWYDDDWRPEDISVQWNAQIDNNNTSFGISNDIRNSYGSSSLGIHTFDNEFGQSYQYGGHVATVFGGEGSDWGWGGKSSAQGALVIEVDTDIESKSGYDLIVNNMNYGQVFAGHKTVVPVMPYKTYTVSISDKNTEFVSFAEKTRYATIYPGNVKALKWTARSVGVLVGRVVRKLPGCFNDNDPACWDPLVTARAKNVNDFSATDTDGYIQAEVFRSANSFNLIKQGKECRVDFSHVEFVEGVGYSEDDLKCVEIDVSEPNP